MLFKVVHEDFVTFERKALYLTADNEQAVVRLFHRSFNASYIVSVEHAPVERFAACGAT